MARASSFLFLPRLAAGLFVLAVLLPYPAYSALRWTRALQGTTHVSPDEIGEVVTRDVAHWLRARLGGHEGVVVSGPTTTTSLIYHGGLKGVGTLYWENLDGLRAASEIFSAPSPEAALALVQRHRITHFAIFSWDSFAEESVRLVRGLAPDAPLPRDAFLLNLIGASALPAWLTPLYYPPPVHPALEGHFILVLEVTPPKSPVEALVSSAQYLFEAGKDDEADAEVRAALGLDPSHVPAWILLARLHYAREDSAGFETAVRQLGTATTAGSLALADRVDLASIFALAGDEARARAQLDLALAIADEASLRRLRSDALVQLLDLAQALAPAPDRSAVLDLALQLLPPRTRAILLDERRLARSAILENGSAARPASEAISWRQISPP